VYYSKFVLRYITYWSTIWHITGLYRTYR